MTDRRLLLVVAVLLAVLVAWLGFRLVEGPVTKKLGDQTFDQGSPRPVPSESVQTGGPLSTSAAPAASTKIPAVAKAGAPGATPVTPGTSVPAVTDPKTPEGAMTETLKAHRMIVDYHTLMGENPVGTNAEIMKALMGANPHQAVLGPMEGQTLNDRGELLDPWGTPYFFHQLSGDVMEIHSAGPDKVMGTADDIVGK